MKEEVNYSDYLQLDRLLGSQSLQSEKLLQPAHDEMLFIVIHQSYELWFKQLLFEVDSVAAILRKPSVHDNSPELQTIVHRLSRCTTILKVLVHQIDIMETMTPMDFLDFRNMLRPASGFQSWQFKILEARLGLTFENRYGAQYYTSQLRPEQVELIRSAEKEPSILVLTTQWLERMPFFSDAALWEGFSQAGPSGSLHPFWAAYRRLYHQSLADPERANEGLFDAVFLAEPAGQPGSEKRALGLASCRAALFIMLYRGYPVLQLPFQLLSQLLEIDEQLSTWRYRHMSMVHRMIGTRIGTGGSSGKEYLKAALDKHYIFKELAQLTSFLIERRALPALTPQMEQKLGFAL